MSEQEELESAADLISEDFGEEAYDKMFVHNKERIRPLPTKQSLLFSFM